MSTPKVGDRMRLTYEGVVSDYDPVNGLVQLNGDECWYDLGNDAKVEVIARPLPTTPGSVIRYPGGPAEFAHLTAQQIWVDDDGDRRNPKGFASVEVIFDAGATS